MSFWLTDCDLVLSSHAMTALVLMSYDAYELSAQNLTTNLAFSGHDALNDATALKELIDSQIGDEEDVERALGL